MTAKKRHGPSFRPNLKLSHVVYPGPEQRNYYAMRRIVAKKVADGRLIEPTDGLRTDHSHDSQARQ